MSCPQPTLDPQPPHARTLSWRAANAAAGFVVFGLPVLLSVPAMIGAWVRFGPTVTISQAAPAAAAVWLPLVMWAGYTRRRPGRWRTAGWVAAGVMSVIWLASSPLWFWVGPVSVVLSMEALRLVSQPVRGRVRMRRRQRPRAGVSSRLAVRRPR